MSITKAIVSGNLLEADKSLDDLMYDIISKKLVEMKKAMVAEQYSFEIEEDLEELDEARRYKIVRVRIRKGKVERRKKVSNVKGYTFRKKGKGPAKLIRMTPTERRKRKLGARRGKIKRRAKKARIRQKMNRVRLKRRSLGLGSKNKTY